MNQSDLLKVLVSALGGNAKGTTKRGKKAKKAKGRTKLTEAEKQAYRSANDAEAVKLFTAAGFADVKPRVNVMTYDKFLDQGRRVRKGEKSIKVGPFSLFHISQTDPVAGVQAQTEAPVAQPQPEVTNVVALNGGGTPAPTVNAPASVQ